MADAMRREDAAMRGVFEVLPWGQLSTAETARWMRLAVRGVDVAEREGDAPGLLTRLS